MVRRIETVIVGAGQAGLATSYWLTQFGREHVVLEQAARPAPVWRDQRWDSFTLVTPNHTLKMPGAEYNGPDPHGFMGRDEIVAYFDRYVAEFGLPVHCHTSVLSVEANDGGYLVRTTAATYQADNVVMATGMEQTPKIPPFAAGLAADITQVHSSRYRNPESLPPGAVLVVGSAQSGCQIAEELYQSGRTVFLCTSNAGRAPRRYRGGDTFAWLFRAGFLDITLDKLPVPIQHFHVPHISGTQGGHTLNLHQFARDGVTLLGHLRGAVGDRLMLAPDMHENLARADGFERKATQLIDQYIQANGLDAPEEILPELRDGFDQPLIESLDLRSAGVTAVIWATGFKFDYRLVKLPIHDERGFPIQTRGKTNHAGLYFTGMPWMPEMKTGVLATVGENSHRLASAIARVQPVPTPV